MDAKKLIASLICAGIGFPLAGMAAAPAVTANVPVDSVYYSYIEKLSGMGYLESLPNGAKPYSRMQMAKWAVEAQEKAKAKPMPAYLEDELQALTTYLAPEMATLSGTPTQDGLKLRSVDATLAYQGHDSDSSTSYRYRQVTGSWQPFGSNRNGHAYGQNGNGILSAEISGNIGHETAIGLRPRFSYDKDNKFSASLDEGYIKTRSGIWAFELGRQSMIWGEGATGTLALSNNMKPLTTIQAHFIEPQKVGGFFRFLREADVHLFYGRLEGDRADRAADNGRHDYDDAGLLGVRVDITPTKYFTFGMSRLSLLGGDGNGLNHSDWKDWITGKNAYSSDKWDDIAGFDFRLRFPGVQFYGEVYGEDQAGNLPSDLGYRFGAYLPQLSRDGSWDMTLEVANTNKDWYRHGAFQNGWTYSGDIMGDSMGTDARKYYIGVRRILPWETSIGFYAMRTEMDRSVTNHPTVDEFAVTGQVKVDDNVYLNASVGLARVQHANYGTGTDRDPFASATIQWRY